MPEYDNISNIKWLQRDVIGLKADVKELQKGLEDSVELANAYGVTIRDLASTVGTLLTLVKEQSKQLSLANLR